MGEFPDKEWQLKLVSIFSTLPVETIREEVTKERFKAGIACKIARISHV